MRGIKTSSSCGTGFLSSWLRTRNFMRRSKRYSNDHDNAIGKDQNNELRCCGIFENARRMAAYLEACLAEANGDAAFVATGSVVTADITSSYRRAGAIRMKSREKVGDLVAGVAWYRPEQ